MSSRIFSGMIGLVLAVAGCDGTGTTIISGSQLAPTHQPGALAFDDLNVYWLDQDGTLYSIPKAGGEPSVVVAGLPPSNPGFGCGFTQLALHDGTFFVGCQGLLEISPQGAVQVIDAYGDAFALDAQSLYWSRPDIGLFRRPLAGGPPTALVMEVNLQVGGLAVADGRLYWSRRLDKSGIWSMPVDGGVPTQVVQEDGSPALGAVVVGGGFVYYDSVAGELHRIALTGGTSSLIAHAGTIDQLASDGTFLYWHESPSEGIEPVKRQPLAGGGTATVVADRVEIKTLASDGQRLFYATDGVYALKDFTSAEGGPTTRGWDVDYSNGGALFSIAH